MSLRNKTQRVRLTLLFSVTAIAGVASGIQRRGMAVTIQEVPLKPGETFEDYRQWRRVNPTMVNMDGQAAAMCHVTPEQQKWRHSNPHWFKWIIVYVNATGEDAMLNQEVPKFPVGSIIVKEKRRTQDEKDNPELLTVMTKMPSGYDPQHGDWQYMGVAGDDRRTIQARGKLANCQSCHDKQAKTGFIYRNYLPDTTQVKP